MNVEYLRLAHMVINWTLLMGPVLKWWIKQVR